jgi:hypothetical protein
MYLSDEKACNNNLINTTKQLISSQGMKLKLMHLLCRRLRKESII